MLRVRPGVELVLASLLPTSELMTLDFPTLDRPRKATSGRTGAGKWPTSVAAIRNRVRTRIDPIAVRDLMVILPFVLQVPSGWSGLVPV